MEFTIMERIFDYYPKAKFEVGITKFIDKLYTCDIAITNSNAEHKLAVIFNLFERSRPNGQGGPPDPPPALITCLETVLAADVPGLNWEYPDTVEGWSRSQLQKHGYTSTEKFPPGWHSDYVRLAENAQATDIEFAEIARSKVIAILRVGIPPLLRRMSRAIELWD